MIQVNSIWARTAVALVVLTGLTILACILIGVAATLFGWCT